MEIKKNVKIKSKTKVIGNKTKKPVVEKKPVDVKKPVKTENTNPLAVPAPSGKIDVAKKYKLSGKMLNQDEIDKLVAQKKG